MQGKRKDRVGHLLQMELSQLILYRLKDPRLGFVTVTHVDMTPDSKSALIFYSVLGTDKNKEDSQKALEKATGFLQGEVATALKLRYTPKLRFQLDESLERGMEVDRIIHKLNKEQSSN